MNEKYYSIKEISELLNVAYLTVYRWVKAGRIKCYKIEKQYRISKTDLDNFMKLNSNKSDEK